MYILLNFFYSSDEETENFNLYFIEFRELIKEMYRCDIDESLIWKNIEDSSEKTLYNEIEETIHEIKKDLSVEKSSLREKINRSLSHKIAGTFSVGALMVFALIFTFLISISLGLYNYLLL